mmetsp:Transcript_4627/g.10015  ORF Transcript_4627/g.10015 Transcript_4627/m.10015 type:complete len:108 (-) Transcript_4627:732-1055(-)
MPLLPLRSPLPQAGDVSLKFSRFGQVHVPTHAVAAAFHTRGFAAWPAKLPSPFPPFSFYALPPLTAGVPEQPACLICCTVRQQVQASCCCWALAVSLAFVSARSQRC